MKLDVFFVADVPRSATWLPDGYPVLAHEVADDAPAKVGATRMTVEAYEGLKETLRGAYESARNVQPEIVAAKAKQDADQKVARFREEYIVAAMARDLGGDASKMDALIVEWSK